MYSKEEIKEVIDKSKGRWTEGQVQSHCLRALAMMEYNKMFGEES